MKGLLIGMTTKSQLENELKKAMLSKDELRKSTIRLALASIKLAEVEKRGSLDEAGITAILMKEVKSRHETIADAQRAQRPDIITTAQAEIAILETFLPKPFSDEELRSLVRQVIAEVGAGSPADMGKVMKALTPRIQGRARGDQVSQVVRQLLQP